MGITADDSHRSIFFSVKDSKHAEQRNERSFVKIFTDFKKDVEIAANHLYVSRG